MSKRIFVTGAALLVACAAHPADSPATSAGATPAPSPAPQQALFSPGFADLMTMLVQPRHLRLFYAGTNHNWELAAFELQSLRAALARCAQAVPKYKGIDVTEAVDAIMGPSLKSMQTVIAAAEKEKFTARYAELTKGCNSCHSYLEHSFIVIRVPEGTAPNPYPNQEFKDTTAEN